MLDVSHIAIRNFAGPGLDLELALAVEALRAEMPLFCRSWSLSPCGLAYYGASHVGDPAEQAVISVVDSSGDASAFARHSQLGLAVYGYVDLSTCRAAGELLSRALSHEAWEMKANPGLDHVEQQADGSGILREVSDPTNRVGYAVEAEVMGNLAVVMLSNYVLPSWYRGGPGPYDRAGIFSRPLEETSTGYHQVVRNGVIVTVGASVRLSSFGRSARQIARALPAMP